MRDLINNIIGLFFMLLLAYTFASYGYEESTPALGAAQTRLAK